MVRVVGDGREEQIMDSKAIESPGDGNLKPKDFTIAEAEQFNLEQIMPKKLLVVQNEDPSKSNLKPAPSSSKNVNKIKVNQSWHLKTASQQFQKPSSSLLEKMQPVNSLNDKQKPILSEMQKIQQFQKALNQKNGGQFSLFDAIIERENTGAGSRDKNSHLPLQHSLNKQSRNKAQKFNLHKTEKSFHSPGGLKTNISPAGISSSLRASKPY